MKGVFFQQPIEYRLEVTGDGFHQGDPFPCVLSVKNHGASRVVLSDLRLTLANGDFKKIKKSSEGAYAVLAAAEFDPLGEVNPHEQRSFPWTFSTDRNCPISDKAQSLHLLIDNGAGMGAIGALPLSVQPHPHIETVLRIVGNTFQFVPRGQKSARGWVNAKFKPPSARRFSLVTEMVLSLHFDAEALELKYLFTVKKFDAALSKVGVKKDKTEVEQRLEVNGYLLSGGFINHAALEAKISEALNVVATGF